ncbi:GNAT family N-acetyltransferase [Hathewaya histolytica]|uniref:GNAT family N-acetyltransferase n=1 Tax=Hathewaya histolytica TaxID=1498 RepID=UPI003B66C151
MIQIIRKAKKEDIHDIMEIVDKVISEMNSYGNYQWDENYPREKDFLDDIEKGDLFICERNDIIAGFISINKCEAPEYGKLNWSLDTDCLVLHRMAVNPDLRRTGIATELMNFAEEFATKQGIQYLKTDTNSLNDKMKNLFKKLHYEFIGEVSFKGTNEPFICYEKVLSE